jgi:hypothetical protein
MDAPQAKKTEFYAMVRIDDDSEDKVWVRRLFKQGCNARKFATEKLKDLEPRDLLIELKNRFPLAYEYALRGRGEDILADETAVSLIREELAVFPQPGHVKVFESHDDETGETDPNLLCIHGSMEGDDREWDGLLSYIRRETGNECGWVPEELVDPFKSVSLT